MTMDKKTIMAIILGVVAVGVVLYQLTGGGASGKRRVAAVATQPATTSAAVASTSQGSSAESGQESLPASDYTALVAKMTESDITFDGRKFRNPMTPLVEEPEPKRPKVSGPATKVVAPKTEALAMGYSLEGIVWGGSDPLALVNNQVVSVGESLDDGAVITEITRDTVRFIRNGNKYYLVLREE